MRSEQLKNLRRAIKFGLVLQSLLWRLEKLGITLNPYYVFVEGEFFDEPAGWKSEFADYCHGFLKRDEIFTIDFLGDNRKIFEERLDRGDLCFGIKIDGRVVAFMWCDFAELNHAPCRYGLEVEEAYLYDARVDPKYRGKGIAPYLRSQVYRALGQYSKTTFLSISDYANSPAIRFKKKLGARFLRLNLYINLWDKYSRNFVIKEYRTRT